MLLQSIRKEILNYGVNGVGLDKLLSVEQNITQHLSRLLPSQNRMPSRATQLYRYNSEVGMKISNLKYIETIGSSPIDKKFKAVVDVTTGFGLWKKTKQREIIK